MAQHGSQISFVFHYILCAKCQLQSEVLNYKGIIMLLDFCTQKCGTVNNWWIYRTHLFV